MMLKIAAVAALLGSATALENNLNTKGSKLEKQNAEAEERATAHLFTERKSGGHRAMVSSVERHENKWVTFPEQKELHSKMRRRGGRNAKPKDSEIVSQRDFFETHREALELDSNVKFERKDGKMSKTTGVRTTRFDQMYQGYKVYGGEFVMGSSSEHRGVLHAHGLPFQSAKAKSYDLTKVNAADAKTGVRDAVSNYLVSQKLGVANFKGYGDMEAVWYMGDVVSGRQGESSLTYLMHGNVKKADQSGMFAFDAFVDVDTMEVVGFLTKSGHFSNPLGSKLNVYDNSRANLNDDQDDDYYWDPDPDRYSDLTLVYDNTAGSSAALRQYPTNNTDLNMIIDNTLYTRNLMLDVSDMQTWAGNDRLWFIEYNMDMFNAYFDGYQGIHFGTGFGTDDITAHEWGHGYTDTMNGLIYYGESGAMNEAFSDIVGETIDLLNNDPGEEATRRSRDSAVCLSGNSGRWLMGEDYFSGGLRDMYWPQCEGDPDSVYSPYLYCGSSDNGGVHWNSGIVNRMYSTLVDGGVFPKYNSNGNPIPGETVETKSVGLEKAMHLAFNAFDTLTPSSQFTDLATAMSEQCDLMIGEPIDMLNIHRKTSRVSARTMGPADCRQVNKVLRGTGLSAAHNICNRRRLSAEEDRPKKKAYI